MTKKSCSIYNTIIRFTLHSKTKDNTSIRLKAGLSRSFSSSFLGLMSYEKKQMYRSRNYLYDLIWNNHYSITHINIVTNYFVFPYILNSYIRRVYTNAIIYLIARPHHRII